MRQLTLDAAIDLLALGLDPHRATLFVQSDVPEVSELCWLLMTGTPMGLLERCHAYKDKKAKGLPADAGLFTYPVLMAADILAYDSDTVPVGEDQVQHIEVCRDLAGSFNHHFGETFVMPKAKLLDASAKVPGTDGEKMSKSYNNTLEVFEEPKAAAEEDHADHDRFAADGTAQGARDRSSVSALFAGGQRRRAGRDGRAVSPRRLRLWRSEKGAGRAAEKYFAEPATAAPVRGESTARDGNPGRRRQRPARKPQKYCNARRDVVSSSKPSADADTSQRSRNPLRRRFTVRPADGSAISTRPSAGKEIIEFP